MKWFCRPFTNLRALSKRRRLPLRQGLCLELLEDRSVPSTMSSISASFNPTAIPAGDTIWFNAALTASNLPKGASVQLHVVNSSISFASAGTTYNVAVPDMDIVLTAGATSASTLFDTSDGGWDVNAPTGGTGTVFMGGVALPVPNGLPGGIKNVTWSAGFWSDTNNISVSWQWSAAVYKSFSTDYNALNVKPVDANNLGINNNDQSGTPEAYKSFVVAGATGGGGNNFTGNYTPTKNLTPQWGDGAAAYPFASSDPLTSVAFNESTVLKAANLDTTNGYFDVWYSDEHALALGVSQVTITTSSGTSTTNYAVSPLGSNPGAVTDPLVGGAYTPPAQPVTVTPTALAASQAQGNTDVSGRPMPPTLYITDITNNPAGASGDWQYGGTSVLPNAVFGTWKSFSETIDLTTATPTVTVTAAADPAKNNWNLGPGADPAPAGLMNEGYGAEVRWNLANLQSAGVLVPGHRYRFYVMVHDGDQNKSGGDAGQAVFTYNYPGVVLSPPSVSGFVFDTHNNPIAGVTVTLTGTDSFGNPLAAVTVVTDGNGFYSFSNLQSGTYTITQTVPSNYTAANASPGTVNNNSDGAVDSSFTLINQIKLNSGDQGINYDFWDAPPVIGA
jgi:hypothetical protein